MPDTPLNRLRGRPSHSSKSSDVSESERQSSPGDKESVSEARREHRRLQAADACAVAVGRFYSNMIEHGVWSNQSELAKDLCVSKAQVSKAVRAAKLPIEVLQALGGESQVTFRVAAVVEQMTRSMGRDVVVANARRMGTSHGLSQAEALSCLATGTAKENRSDGLKLSVGGGGRYLKIESEDVADLIDNIALVEIFLNAFVGRFSRKRTGGRSRSRG